jgi:hypothetical protein
LRPKGSQMTVRWVDWLQDNVFFDNLEYNPEATERMLGQKAVNVFVMNLCS